MKFCTEYVENDNEKKQDVAYKSHFFRWRKVFEYKKVICSDSDQNDHIFDIFEYEIVLVVISGHKLMTDTQHSTLNTPCI